MEIRIKLEYITSYNDAYIPPTHIISRRRPGSPPADDFATVSGKPLPDVTPLVCRILCPRKSGGAFITPDDGMRCNGVFCFWRAIWISEVLKLNLEPAYEGDDK